MQLISEGSYTARAKSIDFINSSKKGTPGVEVVFVIGGDTPFKGREVKWTGWITPETRERTAESLGSCGYDSQNDETISRNEVSIVIEHETWENESGEEKTRAKVSWVNDPGRSGTIHKPMNAAAKQEAQALIRGLILAKKPVQDTGTTFDFGANAKPATPAEADKPSAVAKF